MNLKLSRWIISLNVRAYFPKFFLFTHLECFVDGPKIAKIDPSHPTLRGFEIEYIWENVAEDDVLLGAQTLFISTIFGFLVLVTIVLWNTNYDGIPSSSDSEKKIKPKTASK